MFAMLVACCVSQLTTKPAKPPKLPVGFVRLKLADDTPDAVRVALEGSEQERLDKIADLDMELKVKSRPLPRRGKKSFEAKQEELVRQNRVTELRSSIDSLKRNPVHLAEFDKRTLRVSTIGKFPYPATIVTIPSSTSVILRTRILDSTRDPQTTTNQFFEVVLPNTDTLADDQKFAVGGEWLVSGTSKHGTATVFKLEQIKLKLWIRE